MPLWNVYHPVGAYTEQEKREFADRVTSSYEARGLPRFYVVTLFHEVDRGSFYVGGEPVDDVVRVAIDHIARQHPDPASRESARQRISALIQPFAAGKGLRWEFHIDETRSDLWVINGFAPPPGGSDAEKLWAKENRAIPYADQE
jgi:phenylpyruvate tautomerase PptA (4-oxalocrotonate tautomerase family)